MVNWNNFLAGKSKSARKWYQLRKTCEKCGSPVIDDNLSGFCFRCINHKNRVKGKHSTGFGIEGFEHNQLKKLAREFLQQIGCVDIDEETCVGKRTKGKFLISDVTGRLNGKLVAVECGGILQLGKRKRWIREKRISDMYIFPYGQTVPYKYELNMKVCPKCGHQI